MCGDLRQIPPADAESTQPFWGTATFQTKFEIFVLKEDRRHARSPEIREVKELIAWGGVNLDEATATTQQQRLQIFETDDSKFLQRKAKSLSAIS